MPQPTRASAAATAAVPLRLVPKLLRYVTGSVVATASSEVVFVLLYGVLAMGTIWASVLSWLAGAIPNFWLNRNWTWQRTGRPSLRHEVLPYTVIIVTTLILATIATGLADRWLHQQGTSSTLRVALVAAVFLGVYVAVFVLRFFLLERLFNRRPHAHHDHPATTDAPR
jgi:putative flippase GtrA